MCEADAPVPVPPSPKSQAYVYGPPAPPVPAAVNVMLSPVVADVADAVAVTTKYAMVTTTVLVAVPPFESWSVTVAVNVPAVLYV